MEVLYFILIGVIKTPVGRMRYRTMNAIGDFSYYTPWYKINGARHVDVNGLIANGDLGRNDLFLGVKDTCKSFPSGHTYCAAITFALICLPDLFETFKKKWIKAVCWTVPVVYTLTVAVCRVVVGAHYMSDVLTGGTLSFVITIIVREVLVLNCAHFKAFKKKKKDCEEIKNEEGADE